MEVIEAEAEEEAVEATEAEEEAVAAATEAEAVAETEAVDVADLEVHQETETRGSSRIINPKSFNLLTRQRPHSEKVRTCSYLMSSFYPF